MEGVWDQIERAIKAGDPGRVVDLCVPLKEKERQPLAARAEERTEQQLGISGRDSPQWQAARTALLCLGGPPEGGFDGYQPPYERLEEIVRSRPRPWRDQWARWAVQHGYFDSVATWETLRSLIGKGECARPEVPDDIWLTVLAMSHASHRADGAFDVPSVLRDDLQVPEEEIWGSFAVERDAHAIGHWERWDRALAQLAADGSISRERLIDETLALLARTTDASVAKSLVAFHDRDLAPSPAEVTAREDVYLRWLESDRDAMIGFALRTLTRVDREIPLDGRKLLDRLGVALALRAKSHVKRAVELVGRVMDREPGLVPAGADLAIDALSHPAADVQLAVAAVLERHGDALERERRERLAGLARAADPAVRARIEELAGPAGAPAGAAPPAVAVAVPPASVVDPDTVPRILTSTAIRPVEDIEELLELASLLLEGASDPDEHERFVDGVSRLCDVPIAPGRRTALLRRARRFQQGVWGLTQFWLGPPPEVSKLGWTGPLDALGRRLTALAERVASGRPDVLLSAPTHRGGFLDPALLQSRIERSETIEDYDLAQALLRLPGLGRAAALERLAGGDGEPAAIARAALGDGAPPRAQVSLPASWDSARVLADPGSVEFGPPHTDPWAGVRYEAGEPVSPARLLAAFEGPFELGMTDGLATQRWLALVWPTRRELYYESVVRTLWQRWSELGRIPRHGRLAAALRTMLYPDETLGANAHYLLALSLQAADDNRLLGTDVVIDAIAGRRLVPDLLGGGLAAATRWPDAVPDRWARALAPVADASALHAHELQQLLETTLASLGGERPRIPGVVELLRRVAQAGDARVSRPGARAWLEGVPPSTKAGESARAALEVSGDGAARSHAAAAAASEAERERELRWADA